MEIKPIHDVLLCMPKALQDEIITDSGLKFYIAPDFKPEMQATVVGTVYDTPINKKSTCTLSKGDEVAFGYNVVADRRFLDEAHYFQEATEGSPFFQKYYNAKDELLQIVAVPGIISRKWIGAYINKKGELIDGVQGTEHDLERWKSQFSFGGDGNFTFRNLLEIDGKDYWKCKPEYIFAKKSGDEIVPTGDRLIMKPIDIDIQRNVELIDGNPMPYQELTLRLLDRAELIHDCDELGLKKGDIISFESIYCEKYELWGKEYYLIRQRRALGKWQ